METSPKNSSEKSYRDNLEQIDNEIRHLKIDTNVHQSCWTINFIFNIICLAEYLKNRPRQLTVIPELNIQTKYIYDIMVVKLGLIT